MFRIQYSSRDHQFSKQEIGSSWPEAVVTVSRMRPRFSSASHLKAVINLEVMLWAANDCGFNRSTQSEADIRRPVIQIHATAWNRYKEILFALITNLAPVLESFTKPTSLCAEGSCTRLTLLIPVVTTQISGHALY